MWDTWLFHHQGRYFLYYLCGPGGRWDSFALATSADGVHWEEHGEILHKADDAVWMGTGSTWKSPRFEQDGKFYLNFSEWRGDHRTGQQTIFFAESTDLIHWKRLDKRYEFRPDPRWYNAGRGNDSRWDCIWTIARPGGGLLGYWTGNPTGRPGVGFGETDDGITWRALPPPRFEAGAPHGECGAVERIGEKYYMLLGSGGKMLALVADKPEGPFRPTAKNVCVLAGHTYFARFFPSPDGLLLNHHAIARNGQVSFGMLKRAVVDTDGALRLKWWQGNDRLQQKPLTLAAPHSAPAVSPRILSSNFDAATGIVLEGQIQLPTSPEAPRAGIYLPWEADSGTAILVGRAGVTEIGPIRADGTGFKCESRVDREFAFPDSCRFRLVVCGSLLEFYLDDHLIDCHSLPQNSTGQVGLIHAEAILNLKAWR